jgi:branched-chain amino acid transport system substrate-binding protein
MKKLTVTALMMGVTVIAAACSSPSNAGGSGNSAPSTTSGGESAAQKAAGQLGIDLSKCPTDITKPLTGTIKVGTTLAQTGPIAAALAPVGVGEKVAIADLNATSGLPVKFSLTLLDDQFAPDKTLAAAQQLIQSDNVDLLDGVIGTANIAAIQPLTQQYCMPVIAGNASGATANQPSKYPFITTWSLPSYIDVKAWVQYVKQHFPAGAKVAVFTANTDTGQNYLNAIHALVKGTNITIVSSTTIDATDASAPASQVTSMKASGANVLFAAPSPSGQCAGIVNQVAAQGWKPAAFMLTSQCSTLALMQPAVKAAQGVMCDLYINDPGAASAASDSGLQQIVSAVHKYAPGQPLSGSTITGYSAIEALFKAAEQAAKSPLGLSRLGILYAATHLTYQSATMLPGVTYSLNYPNDEVAMEAAQLSTFNSASGQWQKLKVFNFNGQTTGQATG